MNAAEFVKFVTAGKATVTLESKRTGAHFTFKVECPHDQSPETTSTRFVKVLTGSDNENSYTYAGLLSADMTIKPTRGSRSAPMPPALSPGIGQPVSRAANFPKPW